MKLVLFDAPGNGETRPGVLTDRGVVDVFAAVRIGSSPQHTMQNVIDDFDQLRPALEEHAASEAALPLDWSGFARRCRGRARFSPASPTTGSTPSASRARSTCS